MAIDLLNPISPQGQSEINAALLDLNTVDLAIEKAERAGIDVSILKRESESARTKLSALKSVYFPNG